MIQFIILDSQGEDRILRKDDGKHLGCRWPKRNQGDKER